MKYFITLVLIAVLTSCRGGSDPLRHVDNIMESQPEVALAQLDSLRSTLGGTPFYALLYAEACYKNYVNVEPDSLLAEAALHFAGTPRGLRALFFNGVADYQSQNYSAAMRNALGTYEQARRDGDDYWLAKSAELIADIYYNVYNYEQSEAYVKQAAEAYERCGRIANHRYSLTDLAAVYLNEKKDSLAVTLLDSLEAVVSAAEEVDDDLLATISANRFSARLSVEEAPEVPEESAPTTLDGLLERSEALRRNSNLAQARGLLPQAEHLAVADRDLVRIKYALYQQEMAENNPTAAALVADTVLALQSKIAGEMLKESVMQANSEFYKEKSAAEKHQSEVYSNLLLVAIAVLGVVIVLVVLLARMRIRVRNAELEAAISSLATYRQSAEQAQTETYRQSELIEELFRERWTTINLLCNEYFERADSDLARRTVVNNIEGELAKLRTPASLRKIEEAVDAYMGGVVNMLRAECPWLKEDDVQFLALVFAGLSTRAVCLFTGIKYKYYYLKKSRLSKRIKESDAPHRTLFLSKL